MVAIRNKHAMERKNLFIFAMVFTQKRPFGINGEILPKGR